MVSTAIVMLSVIIFMVAIMYSSIGHGGASGYIAAMALFGILPAVLKPTALCLNLTVSFVAALCFARAGYFSWSLFWPFALTSVATSFVGGYINLPLHLYKILLGCVLFISAYRLLAQSKLERGVIRRPTTVISLVAGAVIGLISGLIGVGGGIFLSPLLVLMGWAEAKEASAVSAVFILVNSASGLLGYLYRHQAVPDVPSSLIMAAIVGGIIGSYAGCHKLPRYIVVRTLSFVLLTAGSKMILV